MYDEGTTFAVQYLAADMSIDCSSSDYEFLRAYAMVMVVALPLGVPIVMHNILSAHREAIKTRTSQRGEDVGLDHLSLWFSSYKPDKWW